MRVKTTVVLEASPPQAFAFVANFENSPRWQGGM